MAIPSHLQGTLSPQELAFLAEQEQVEIVPLFAMSPVRLLSGVFGPFQPPRKARVPLWLATSLKRKKKCRIVPPEWVSADHLSALVQAEKEDEGSFQEIPRHFIEVTKILLDVAPEDLDNPSALHSLLLELRHIRLAKIRHALRPAALSSFALGGGASGLAQSGTIGSRADTGSFSGGGDYLRLTGLTPIEVGEMREFLGGVMRMMRSLRDGEGEGGEEGEQGNGFEAR